MNQDERYKIINGNSLDVLDTLEPNSIDAIITDPPYGLTSITKRFGKENSAPAKEGKDGSFARLSKGFMGKEWDGTGIEYNVSLWEKAYKVLKSGGYLLAFGGSRTFHRIACAIEDAGFEIRDTIMWLYGSGFPKSMNIGLAIDKKNGVESIDTGVISPNARPNCDKTNTLYESGTVGKNFTIKKATNEWNGWGTALKPAYEPIIVARKPVEDSVVNNVLKYGVGGINIDECRVPLESNYKAPKRSEESRAFAETRKGITQCDLGGKGENAGANEMGRFPANVILTYDDSDFDEVCGGMPETKSTGGSGEASQKNTFANVKIGVNGVNTGDHLGGLGDEGNACRYFYCAKASKKDRDNGLDMFEDKRKCGYGYDLGLGNAGEGMFKDRNTFKKNIHPTVKPVELMQYLVRLVTPLGGVVLDIFNGSGSTGKAVAFENRERNADYKYIGIELEKEYCEISKARIDYAINKYEYDMIQDIKEEEKETGQMSLFDFKGGDDID